MADYLADPLWYRSPRGAGTFKFALDRLPLSANLKGHFRAWASRYDTLVDTGYAWHNAAAEAAWVVDGRVLLQPVKDELGPDYDVQYFADGGSSLIAHRRSAIRISDQPAKQFTVGDGQ